MPQDHLAHFILDVVDELDLSAIVGKYAREERGYPPYHPKLMVALLLYAYSTGAPSSRKIEKRRHEDIGFRVIAAKRRQTTAASATSGDGISTSCRSSSSRC